MSCCQEGLAFYKVTENGILVTQEKDSLGWLAVMSCNCKFFGKIMPKSFCRITCQKTMISSKYDRAIEHLKRENDWGKNPVCGLEYLPEKELVKMTYEQKE